MFLGSIMGVWAVFLNVGLQYPLYILRTELSVPPHVLFVWVFVCLLGRCSLCFMPNVSILFASPSVMVAQASLWDAKGTCDSLGM